MSERLLCVNCVYFDQASCRRVVVVNDLVWGKDRYEEVNVEREPKDWYEKLFGSKRCGPEGKYWEESK